ncbi:MAG: hypothetical protein IJL66_08495 [Lachnospiraceae bacterium]|nr:hypothetical protein [Lachnospiraceae bacterium]
MEKKKYVKPVLSVLELSEDVIAASLCPGDSPCYCSGDCGGYCYDCMSV